MNATFPEDRRYVLRLSSIPGSRYFHGQLVRLHKLLYGLREAPKLWYEKCKKTRCCYGFEQSAHSDCLFILKEARPVYIVAHMDDLFVIGNKVETDSTKKLLASKFITTELGPCSFYLGIGITRSSGGLLFLQAAFVSKVVSLVNLQDAKPAPTPLSMSQCLYEERNDVTEEERTQIEAVLYSAVLGYLLFLATRTRPDTATAVLMLSKFQSSPMPRHWKVIKHFFAT